MPKERTLKIVEEPNVIDDHLLDIIGQEFRFNHEKGLAELLKNSIDAYLQAGTPDSQQDVIFRFIEGNNDDAVFECIDFIGMTEVDIEKAFKRWGDPEAAKRGLKRRVYGGHGNGGKFYMRQMFDRSHFVTYKNGYLNIFGFSENKKYGFADGFKNKKIKVQEALKIAKIANITFPGGKKDLLLSGKTGFTLVRGISPHGMRRRIRLEGLLEKFKNHPQSRRILERANIWIDRNESKTYSLLRPDELAPLPDFAEPRVISIPESLTITEEGEQIAVPMNKKGKYPLGKLVLRTSEEALGMGGRLAELNRIDIIGEIGAIGSYQLYKLGIRTFPQASFIYGECECPILEDPEMDSVKNDRTELVENPRSKALLAWICDRVEGLSAEIAAKEREEYEVAQREISKSFNEYLNRWKDQFMPKLIGSLFTAGIDGSTGEEIGSRGKNIAIPPNGFAFTFPAAEIGIDIQEKITLKALVPKPVPIGSIISLKTTNNFIQLLDKEIIVKSQNVRTVPTGETVAVLNIMVIGKKIGEEGELEATVGKLSASMRLKVTEVKAADKSKKPKSPQVLLSAIDPDPLGIAPGGTLILSERDPVVYQRYQDVNEGIYWINTQSPLAANILDRYGDYSPRWRDFLFQRYVDIFVKQAIHELQKRDPESFRADRIDSDLDSLIRRIHTAAAQDLGGFLFDEEFEPTGLLSEEAR